MWSQMVIVLTLAPLSSHAAASLRRAGHLWGPGTYYPAAPPNPPRIHVDDAARQTLPALGAPPGVTIVADDRATHDP